MSNNEALNNAIHAAVEQVAPKVREAVDIALMKQLVNIAYEDMRKKNDTFDELQARGDYFDLASFHNGIMPIRSPNIQLLQPTFPSVKCGGCRLERPLDKVEKCGRCKLVYYCNIECQRNHWRAHKESCNSSSSSSTL